MPRPSNLKSGNKAFGGSASEGLRYEKKVALLVHSLGFRVKHNQWFRFRDAKGVGFCELDVLGLGADRLLVIEAKLTQKAEGEVKLDRLYVPLMKEMYKVPVFPILVFRNILWEPKRLLPSLADVLSLPMREQDKVYHLHWIGG